MIPILSYQNSTLNWPHSRCSDFLIVILWYTKVCFYFLYLYYFYYYFFFWQARDMSFKIIFLYWNYLFHVAYFHIDDFCLIYWFHCTNVLLICVFYFTQWLLSWLFFCVNFWPHNSLPQIGLLSAAFIFFALQSMFLTKQLQSFVLGILFLPFFPRFSSCEISVIFHLVIMNPKPKIRECQWQCQNTD